MEGYAPLSEVGPRAFWAAKLAGLMFWTVVACLATLGTTPVMALVPYWFQRGYSRDMVAIVEGCMSISCMDNKTVCISLVRDNPSSCDDVLWNATLACTTEAHQVITDCTLMQKNVKETGDAWRYLTVMNWVIATGIVVFTFLAAASVSLIAKSREVWNSGPPVAHVPMADVPPDAEEGDVHIPVAAAA
jgi:hypothetical protein